MGNQVNDGMSELPFAVEGQRDLAVESMYEYGTRAGIWRLFRIFDAASIPITCFGAAVALERNPAVAAKLAKRGDEVAGHGYRWSNHYEMNKDEEREAIKRAVASIEKTTGTRPVGWYCREMSVNTRELVVEEGGFFYDSECYSDDLPYWTTTLGRSHLVVPYSLVVNDARYIVGTGYGSPEQIFETAKACLDRLRNDGNDLGRIMRSGCTRASAGARPGPMVSHDSSTTPGNSAMSRSCGGSTSRGASRSRYRPVARLPFVRRSAGRVRRHRGMLLRMPDPLPIVYLARHGET